MKKIRKKKFKGNLPTYTQAFFLFMISRLNTHIYRRLKYKREKLFINYKQQYYNYSLNSFYNEFMNTLSL